jgi:hypothetical protein
MSGFGFKLGGIDFAIVFAVEGWWSTLDVGCAQYRANKRRTQC